MELLRRQLTIGVALGAALGGLGGCGGDFGRARAEPAGVVDSALSRDEALARFREDVPEVAELAGSAPSLDSLITRFVFALEQADTAALRRSVLSRAEFAWLYYPTNPQGLPPYDLAPGLMWDMLSLGSDKGLRRMLYEFGGRPLGYRGYACDPVVSHQGRNTVFGPCSVTLRLGVDTGSVRLFGLVVERDGRHKFVSYANKL